MNLLRTISDLRSKDARGVCAEDGVLRGVGIVVVDTGHVVVDGLELLKSGKIAAELLGPCTWSTAPILQHEN